MDKTFVTKFLGGKVGGGANVGTSLETIKKGDILLINTNTGAVLTGGGNDIANAPVISVVTCMEDGVPLVSKPIYGAALVSGSRQDYSAPVQEVRGFGYSSVNTAGNISSVSELTTYTGAIVFDTESRLLANKQDRLDFSVESETGGYDAAVKIVRDINREADVNPHVTGKRYIKATVKTNGTEANIGTAATATVISRSREVVFGAAHGLSVGNIVMFPNGGTYKVASVPNTTTIMLDYPYQGDSEVYPADTAKSLTSVDLYGVQLDAYELERISKDDEYNIVKFSVALSNGLAGLEDTEITAYTRGQGSGWETRDLEVKHLGWNGYSDRNNTKRLDFPFFTDFDRNYDVVSLYYEESIRGDFYNNNDAPNGVLLVFDAAASTQKDAVMAILAPWAASGGIDLS